MGPDKAIISWMDRESHKQKNVPANGTELMSLTKCRWSCHISKRMSLQMGRDACHGILLGVGSHKQKNVPANGTVTAWVRVVVSHKQKNVPASGTTSSKCQKNVPASGTVRASGVEHKSRSGKIISLIVGPSSLPSQSGKRMSLIVGLPAKFSVCDGQMPKVSKECP